MPVTFSTPTDSSSPRGDPIAALTSRFGWGADFDHDALVSDLALVLDAVGIGVRTAPIRRQFADRFFAPGQLDAVDAARELTIELVNGMSGSTFVDAGLSLVPIPQRPGDAVSELLLTNVTAGATAAESDLGNGWVLRLAAGLDETGAVGARLAPGGVSFEEQPVGGDARWSLEGTPVGGWSLIGGLIELARSSSNFDSPARAAIPRWPSRSRSTMATWSCPLVTGIPSSGRCSATAQ